jgi:hypothetical protein
MTSEKQLPDARDNAPSSSGPRTPKLQRRASAREVAESPSKACDASCKTDLKMRHKISIFLHNPHKQIDLHTAQIISCLPANDASQQTRRPTRTPFRRRQSHLPGNSLKTELSRSPSKPVEVRPRFAIRQLPQNRTLPVAGRFKTSPRKPKPISHNPNQINKKMGSFLHFAPTPGPDTSPLWLALPKAVEWNYPLPPPGEPQARSPV